MTALRATALDAPSGGGRRCSRPPPMTAVPRWAARSGARLRLIAGRPARWPAGVAGALARLTAPINDVLAVAGLKPGSWAGAPTRGRSAGGDGPGADRVLGVGSRRGGSGRSLAGTSNVRQLVIAVAYQLCGISDLHWEIRGFKCRLFCGRVFGPRPLRRRSVGCRRIWTRSGTRRSCGDRTCNARC